MDNDDLQRSLRRATVDPHGSDPGAKASAIVALCGYYGFDTLSAEVRVELQKLTDIHVDLQTLDNLTSALRRSCRLEADWQPFSRRWNDDIQGEGSALTLSPCLQIQSPDNSALLAEIAAIRASIRDASVNYALLIGHVATQARAAGDLQIADDED